jgi:hypothetical protein
MRWCRLEGASRALEQDHQTVARSVREFPLDLRLEVLGEPPTEDEPLPPGLRRADVEPSILANGIDESGAVELLDRGSGGLAGQSEPSSEFRDGELRCVVQGFEGAILGVRHAEMFEALIQEDLDPVLEAPRSDHHLPPGREAVLIAHECVSYREAMTSSGCVESDKLLPLAGRPLWLKGGNLFTMKT